MITKNYYRVLAYLFSGYGRVINIKNYLGANKDLYNSNNAYNCLTWGISGDDKYIASMKYIRTSLDGNSGVILGNGDTAPTPDDYKLAGQIITGFTYTAALEKVVSDTAVTVKAIYTITNANSTEITIKEIGLISSAQGLTSQQYKFLLDRTVLDTPVTIPANGFGQVEYTITFNLPTAT